MFPMCDKKDFENFLILSMIVIFALTILSRSILVVLDLAKKFNIAWTVVNSICLMAGKL